MLLAKIGARDFHGADRWPFRTIVLPAGQEPHVFSGEPGLITGAGPRRPRRDGPATGKQTARHDIMDPINLVPVVLVRPIG
ncbi:hypothetical protein [Streptomyces sp. NRRL WC-3725]|uniref:hypothetical protein n=1 Tax=Streptomyces sp. NRRL WC-3725 TaxID=1463933 RepID=UPI0004C9C6BB|nr:hypothetical protein [Streptomyces sp. NRRL WC-3725]